MNEIEIEVDNELEKKGIEEKIREEKDLDLHEKLNTLRNTIEENRRSGRKIDDDFLSYNFDHNFISQCIESGLLIKQGNDEYVFGD